jgi:hypothetical protein
MVRKSPTEAVPFYLRTALVEVGALEVPQPIKTLSNAKLASVRRFMEGGLFHATTSGKTEEQLDA